MWYQVCIDGAGDVRLPMARGSCKKYQPEEDVRENARNGQRSEGATEPALHGCCGTSRRKRELQCILLWASRDAYQARSALH